MRNCEFDTSPHKRTDSDGNITEFYAIVRSNGPSKLVVSFGEENLQKMNELEDKGNERERQLLSLYSGKVIEGVLQYGLLKQSSYKNFDFEPNQLASDFVILEEGTKPSFWGSVMIIINGFIVLAIWYEIRKMWKEA